MPFRSPIDLGIAQVPDGIPDELFPIFNGIYIALHNLQQSLGDYTGVNFADVNYLIENALGPDSTILIGNMQILRAPSMLAIGAGLFVNLVNNSGVLSAQKAQANALATRAHAFSLNTTTAAGQPQILVLNSGYNPTFAALTVAQTYYLSTVTPGGIQNTKPVAVGTIAQEVGFALSSTEVMVRLSTPILN